VQRKVEIVLPRERKRSQNISKVAVGGKDARERTGVEEKY